MGDFTPMKRYGDLGKHTECVVEVLEFVNSGNLFATPLVETIAAGNPLHIIDTFEGIIKYQDTDVPGAMISGLWWTDILEQSIPREYYDENIYKEYGSIYYNLIRLHTKDFYSICKRCVDGRIPPINDYTSEYLDSTAIVRGKLGLIKNSLTEKMYSAIVAGGYPCGWIGAYPEGKMVVFSVASAPPGDWANHRSRE